jgi:hypothetical protein
MLAGFLVLADFMTAVIAKKARLFTQFLSTSKINYQPAKEQKQSKKSFLLCSLLIVSCGGLCLAFRF